MSLRQKIKIILQVFFICLVFLVNASIYQKYNYFSAAQHLNKIPSNALFSITFNTKAFGTKLLRTFLYKNSEFSDLLDELEPDKHKPGEFLELGIDISNQVSVYFYSDLNNINGSYVCVLADLVSPSNTKNSLIKQGFKQAKDNNFYQRDALDFAVMDDNVISMIHFLSKDLKIEDKNDILHSVTENKKNHTSENVIALLKQENEFVLNINPQFIRYKSWIENITCYGKMVNDGFDIQSEVKFTSSIENYFNQHEVNPKFDFSTLNGYSYLKSSFNAPNANDIFNRLKIITFSDSLTSILSQALENQYAKSVELYCYNLQKAELLLSPDAPTDLKILSKNFLLPAFDFKLHCSNSKQMDTVFNQLSFQNKITKQENNWFVWNRDKYYSVYFGVKDDWLNITTKKELADQMPNTGYSNVFYFNTDKFSEKIPFFGSQLLADEFKLFEYLLFYTTAAKANQLNIKGKIVLATGKDGVLELLKTLVRLSEKDFTSILAKAV